MSRPRNQFRTAQRAARTLLETIDGLPALAINNTIRPDGCCAERYTMSVPYELDRSKNVVRIRPVYCPLCALHYTTMKPMTGEWPSSVAHVICADCGGIGLIEPKKEQST